MAFSKEFKEAISNLPSKEKDKIIFRLLRKDVPFTNRLMFELISEESVDDKREEVKKQLQKEIEKSVDRFKSVKYLNIDIRYMSGVINEYVYITKDKYGEIALNIFITIGVLEGNQQNIIASNFYKAQKFCIGIVARIFKILLLLDKQHDDLLLDFEDDLKKLAMLIEENPHLNQLAGEHGLNIEWLKNAELPEDLSSHYKMLRAQGYLK